MKILRKILILAIALFLVSCSSQLPVSEPIHGQTPYMLEETNTLGQTFVARYEGLDGIEIYLQPGGDRPNRLNLHLRSSPFSQTDIAQSSLQIKPADKAASYRFNFAPQTDSRQKYYYFFLEIEGDGKVPIAGTGGDTYLDGSMYRDHNPLDAQIVHQLHYNPFSKGWGLIKEFVKWGGISLIGIFLYILPGLALIYLFWPAPETLSLPLKITLAGGISLALYPLLMLWTHLLGVQLGPIYGWGPPGLALLYLIWRFAKTDFSYLQDSFQRWRQSKAFIPDLALIILVGILLLTRFYATRTLDVPMWGDSFQHTLIAQLLVENAGLFDSWAPYVELDSFTYHYGFHAAVAAFQWVTGRSAIRSTLWVGQIINVLAVVSIYGLASRFDRNRWAGTLAILIAGLLSPMPMYYLNWGRYTQLAGLAILPCAIYLAWEALESERLNWSGISLNWIIFAGLALTHYRVTLFAAIFFLAKVIYSIPSRSVWSTTKKGLLLASGAIVLFMPWFLNIFAGNLPETFSAIASTKADALSAFAKSANFFGEISFYIPDGLWILFLVSIGWILWHRKRDLITLVIWWLLLLIAANPLWFGLPGTGIISNFAVMISAYIPVAVCVGFAACTLIQRFRSAVFYRISLLLLILLAIFGATRRIRDLDPQKHMLATRPDIRASAWIKENTDDHDRFLVNSFYTFGGAAIVGSDGGWWLPLLADRQTNVPPLNYVSEHGSRPGYVQRINSLTATLQNHGVTSPEVLAALRELGFHYVYVGQRQGRVNYIGPHTLDPALLIGDPNYELVYYQDRVWIFRVKN